MYACVLVCDWVSMCSSCSVTDPFGEIRTRYRRFRFCAPYGPDTLAIRGPTHGMIQRFVPVHAVKIRRRFSLKTALFYVSVCLLIYFNFSDLFYCFMRVCIILHYSVHDHAHFIDIHTCVVIFWDWNVFDRLPTWC